MTKKQELYYLLNAFKRGEYEISTFCKVFEDIFYPDVPKSELSVYELEKFEDMAKIIVRFTPYEEDLKLPNVYYNEEEVRAAIEIAYVELIDHKRAK